MSNGILAMHANRELKSSSDREEANSLQWPCLFPRLNKMEKTRSSSGQIEIGPIENNLLFAALQNQHQFLGFSPSDQKASTITVNPEFYCANIPCSKQEQ